MKDAGDHISREAAIEAICEDCFMHKMNQCKAKTKEMYCSDYQRIMDIPAADVRPVVLCKDCKMMQFCKITQYLGADGFCSIGEKKRCELYNDCEYRAIWKCCCDDCQFMEGR